MHVTAQRNGQAAEAGCPHHNRGWPQRSGRQQRRMAPGRTLQGRTPPHTRTNDRQHACRSKRWRTAAGSGSTRPLRESLRRCRHDAAAAGKPRRLGVEGPRTYTAVSHRTLKLHTSTATRCGCGGCLHCGRLLPWRSLGRTRPVRLHAGAPTRHTALVARSGGAHSLHSMELYAVGARGLRSIPELGATHQSQPVAITAARASPTSSLWPAASPFLACTGSRHLCARELQVP